MDNNEEIIRELEKYPKAIEPIYSMDAPNEEITLFEGDAHIEQRNTKANVLIRIYQAFLPDDSICFTFEQVDSINLNDSVWDIGEIKIYLTSWETKLTGHILNTSIDARGYLSIKGKLLNGASIQKDENQRIKYAIAHTVNYRDYIGDVIKDNNHCSWIGRCILNYLDWKITLDKISNFAESEKSLKNTGGYIITHVVHLIRKDEKCFPSEEASDILNCLQWFLSLTRGSFVSPILPIGFDGHDQIVWQEWQNRRADTWKYTRSFVSDFQYAEEINQIFQGFVKRWQNSLWRDELKILVHWYRTANRNVAALEGSVVIAQTALELLAWVWLVEDERSFESDNFKNFSAFKRIEELLKRVGVTSDIPSSLPDLKSFSGNRKGPEAITYIRNSIEHPNIRGRVQAYSHKARYEAVDLSLWYLELALLRLFDYHGRYANRVSGAQYGGQEVEQVPWNPVRPNSASS